VLAGGLAVLLRAFVEAAGGPFGPGDLLESYAGAGLQMGFLAGPFVVAGVLVAVPRRAVLYGAAVLAVLAVAPAVRPAPGDGRVLIGTGVWRETRPLTIDVSHPLAQGENADRINAALLAPIRTLIEETGDATRVTGTYTVVRNDAQVISVRYLTTWEGPHPGERAQAVTVDTATGRQLTALDIFTPAALSRAGRERLAAELRPLLPPGASANPAIVRVDGDFVEVNPGNGAVEFTFGRGYLCDACPAVTVRVPRERLPGLLRL
jgi:hypothetical protein